MANRFDQPYGQRYVSTYVPLPFQELAMLGEHMQKKALAKQDEMTELEQKIADTKVANQVLSEGSNEEPGLKYKDTGYGQFKEDLLNRAKTAHSQITEDYLAGKLSPYELERKTNEFNRTFKNDFNKLKVAEANSSIISKQDEEFRKHKTASLNPYLVNAMAAEGKRFLQDPFSQEYKGAPIGEALNIEDEINKSAQHFADQIGKNGAYRDKYGNIVYQNTHGVTPDRIRNEVYSAYDKGVGVHTKEQVMRSLLDDGINPDTERTIKVPSKFDSKGNPTEYKDVKTDEFTYRYNNAKKAYADAVVDKAEKSVLDEQVKKDWLYERSLDKKDAEEEAKKQFAWTSASSPSDPNNPNNTYEGINNSISGSKFGEHWKLDENGVLTSAKSTDKYINGFKIDGKVYSKNDKLPSGYSTTLNDNGSTVLMKNGKVVGVETSVENPSSSNNLQQATKELLNIADNLGITKNMSPYYKASSEGLHQLKRDVASYFKQAYSLEMDYVRMDPGSIKALTDQFGVKGNTDKNGNLIINNPGSLSYVEIKDANGNLVNPDKKAAILTNAQILGPSFSLVNTASKPGDLKLQGSDGQSYIINTGMSNIKNALSEPYKATKDLHNYVITGKKGLSDYDKKEINEFSNSLSKDESDHLDLKRSAISLVKKDNASYIYYIKPGLDENGNVQMGAYKVTPQYTLPMTISDANTEISQDNMFNIMPTQNIRNFDRVTSFDKSNYKQDNED